MSVNDNANQRTATSLLGDLTLALAKQRQALTMNDWKSLADVIPRLQDVVSAISHFPGGVNGVREALRSIEPEARRELDGLLEAAAVDRRASTELIKINLQRFYALKSIYAVSQFQDTYGQEASSPPPGMRVSTRV